ncbi:MAG: oxidoreductase [Hydrocarboniphaga sp.]|uniref:NAD(P)-dependent oxidoreductase n=1 Tax=Hydrocarboniphaga sp. TaxID=2033016 RepID=UPI00261711E0|nr:NAD(P)-dependent oxidoreductase [Hydrocarboniphaga sp.]MDB5968538.1 oxidoreductase [Hydrocarboniphaga sp.]
MKIGFIGLGEMGRPMAANQLKAGHQLTVWNRSAERAGPLVEAGASLAASAADVAADADAILLMLADDHALRSVMSAGLLAAIKPATVVVNHSTVSVAYARELSAAVTALGATYVAAPVFGRPPVAEAGQLNIVLAGDDAGIDKVRPALNAMAKKCWPFGAIAEQANVVKIAGNLMIASAIQSMAEASALVRAHGIEAGGFIGMMTQTLFATPVYSGYGSMIAERRYEPAGFKAQLGLKDVELGLSAAASVHLPLPIAGVIRDALLDALAHGGGDQDWSVLGDVAARRAALDGRRARATW